MESHSTRKQYSIERRRRREVRKGRKRKGRRKPTSFSSHKKTEKEFLSWLTKDSFLPLYFHFTYICCTVCVPWKEKPTKQAFFSLEKSCGEKPEREANCPSLSLSPLSSLSHNNETTFFALFFSLLTLLRDGLLYEQEKEEGSTKYQIYSSSLLLPFCLPGFSRGTPHYFHLRNFKCTVYVHGYCTRIQISKVEKEMASLLFFYCTGMYGTCTWLFGRSELGDPPPNNIHKLLQAMCCM